MVYYIAKVLKAYQWKNNDFMLGALHNCQLLTEWTKHTLFKTTLPPHLSNTVHINIFKWIICDENDNKLVKMLKVYGINVFFFHQPPLKEYIFLHPVKCWQLWTAPYQNIKKMDTNCLAGGGETWQKCLRKWILIHHWPHYLGKIQWHTWVDCT